MAGYKFLVLTNAVAGQEDEYNDWYTNRHLADIVAIPGFSAAQRFIVRLVKMGEIAQKYLAIYEMDVPDLASAREALIRIAGTEMEISPALDGDSIVTGLFEPRSEIQEDGALAGPFRVLAMTDAVPGRENEFSDWYGNVHIRELMAHGGYVSAEFFHQEGDMGYPFPNNYLALYTMTGQDWAVAESTMANAAAGNYTPSDAGQKDNVRLAVYDTFSPRVTARA